MDIVIPLGNGSKHNNLELRYCLRSIEKFVADLGNVFIIGECPTFLHNLIHIPARDFTEKYWKARSICSKLLLACGDKRVSDEFAWFCDDHFLLREYTPDYNYRDTLQSSICNFTIHQTYRHTMVNTYLKMNEGMDYGHGPMVFNKALFTRATALVDWNERWGYVIKSLYCGFNGIGGHKYPDLKIKEPLFSGDILRMIHGRPYFSISDGAINSHMIRTLEFLYPDKSRFEL